jgi:hypothetical protein
MKRNIVFSFLKAALIFGAFSQTLLAQSDLHLKADIPFAFVADGKIQAPGSYDLQQLRPSVIVLRNLSNGSASVIRTTADRREKGTEGRTLLLFNRYGDTYFLNQFTLDTNDIANRIHRSPSEHVLAQQFQKPQLVIVSLAPPNDSTRKKNPSR